MYHMKNIVTYEEDILLPKCMYNLKSINPVPEITECNETIEKVDLGISNQSSKGMAELQKRQDQLLEKLDLLYDRIKMISLLCNTQASEKVNTISTSTEIQLAKIQTPDEIVISASPDNLPWYLCFLLKEAKGECIFAVTWHIHSSVSPDETPKIHDFIKKYLPSFNNKSSSNIRLIFKKGESEIKLSSKFIPIVGDVNILRYLSYVYPNILPYEENFSIDALLDLCHLLQKANEKERPEIVGKLFAQYEDWIYMKQFSIVDVAAYNIIKQWPICPKYVPRPWYNKCQKL